MPTYSVSTKIISTRRVRKLVVLLPSLIHNTYMQVRKIANSVASVCAIFLVAAVPVSAQQALSPNYQVNEVTFGGGGELNACSSTYCAKQSAAEIAAGNIAGNAFKAQAGFNTDREPYLAFSVAGSSTDLGTLSALATAHATGTFAVRSYLSSGYVVQLASDPPTSNGNPHVMSAPTSPVAPAVGTEQFGVNAIANTSACGASGTFGANPVQVPDNTFSVGSVASGYNTCGLFKYVKGDVIASSTQSSGETDYTLSFIYNISSVTPDGQYTYDGTLVATATY